MAIPGVTCLESHVLMSSAVVQRKDGPPIENVQRSAESVYLRTFAGFQQVSIRVAPAVDYAG